MALRTVGGLGVGIPRAGTPLEPGPLASPDPPQCSFDLQGPRWQPYKQMDCRALLQ